MTNPLPFEWMEENKFLNIVDGGGTGRIGGMMSGLKDAENPSDN